MKFDKSPHWLVQLFDALQPEVGGVRRVMFGYPAAFDDGLMYACLFGDGLMVRLEDPQRAALLRLRGAAPFAPRGRPSRHWILLPPSMLEDEEAVKSWMRKALAFTRTLPPKKPRARKAR
jgi:TfoX/Sxy family transcriptional regulator of competence genes